MLKSVSLDLLQEPTCVTLADYPELFEDVKRHGIIHPIVISEDYQIRDGRGRYLAAKAAGFVIVPCLMMQKPINSWTDVDS